MRMWNVKVSRLCRNHLLGEHLEMHMFLGCLKKGISLKGYIKKGLVEVHNIVKRHDNLALELVRRGYFHRSPMVYPDLYKAGRIDVKSNILELRKRCFECK
jgi:hypothetical protein